MHGWLPSLQNNAVTAVLYQKVPLWNAKTPIVLPAIRGMVQKINGVLRG